MIQMYRKYSQRHKSKNVSVIHMETPSLTQEIKNEAYRQGFQLVGITSPKPPPHLKTYLTWLEKGYHASMTWIETDRARQRRADPLKILPDCKSILVLGIRYPKPAPSIINNTHNPKVASYAYGNDYHDILPTRLNRIVSFIRDRTGKEISNRYYTDTGAILERELAQQAGLGWIGKNSCLINPESGSYFLLAEIFLGIELEIDQPLNKDFCGSCNRCIKNCPTSCITLDRMIDSNRCISYLTIEHKGFIPEEVRPKIENWLFGCDICQIVCPWNQKFAGPKYDPAFTVRPGIPPSQLSDELMLTPEHFNQKFKGNPIKRAKRRGYLRNVAIVLGNIRDKRAVPSLCNALNDPDELVRGHAAWALGQIGGENARQALSLAHERESHPKARVEMIRALNQIENIPKVKSLYEEN